jgi:hypothetical protein
MSILDNEGHDPNGLGNTPARIYISEMQAEIKRLQASELAWKIIAKQNDRWSALPQSEKEAALNKALESEVAEGCRKDADIEVQNREIERLRAALLQCKHGAEYCDELGDLIDAALEQKGV